LVRLFDEAVIAFFAITVRSKVLIDYETLKMIVKKLK
jgi:hypothetical protein